MCTTKSIHRLCLWLLALALLVSGCAQGAAQASLAQSELGRVTDPAVSAEDQHILAAGNRAFALDLYRQLRSTDGNLIFSPYSISLALAMTYAGARGETARQMREVLHFGLVDERLHPAFNALDRSLAGLAEAEGGGISLEQANSLWAQQGFDFLPEFLDLLAQDYGAGVRLVDYAGDTEAARRAINAWVEAQTHDRIQELFKQGVLDSLTRLVLVNAIYFKADWQTQFDRSATQDGDFHLLDGKTVRAPMMTFEGEKVVPLSYGSGEGYQAVGLPYANPEVEMVILLPEEGNFEAFEAGLDGEQLAAILDGMSETEMKLYLPRFKSQAEFSLPETLMALGMLDAFGGQADFSGMDGRRDLYVKDVVHKAFVEVNEQGAEAAAATGVVMLTTSLNSRPPEVRVDRPFIYLVYDRTSGSILFLGRVLDPQA
jgi:serpin B